MSQDVKDAHTAVQQAIAELKAKGIEVPISLHRAAHAFELRHGRAPGPDGPSRHAGTKYGRGGLWAALFVANEEAAN